MEFHDISAHFPLLNLDSKNFESCNFNVIKLNTVFDSIDVVLTHFFLSQFLFLNELF